MTGNVAKIWRNFKLNASFLYKRVCDVYRLLCYRPYHIVCCAAFIMCSVGHDSTGMQWHSADSRRFQEVHVHGGQSPEWLAQLLRDTASWWFSIDLHSTLRISLSADLGRWTWSTPQLDRDQHGSIRHPRTWSRPLSVRNTLFLVLSYRGWKMASKKPKFLFIFKLKNLKRRNFRFFCGFLFFWKFHVDHI